MKAAKQIKLITHFLETKYHYVDPTYIKKTNISWTITSMSYIKTAYFTKMPLWHDVIETDFNPRRLKKVREKSREWHNHKPQPFPDPKRKSLNKHKPNKRTKSTKISSLFPKRGNRNTKRTEKHNKMTHGKTYNKSPRRKNPTKQQRVRLTPGPPP